MKKIIMLSVSALVILLAACKKDNPVQILPTEAVSLVKTFTISQSGSVLNSVTSEYDAQGRRARITYLNGAYLLYTYSPDKMNVESFDISGISQAKYTWHLASNGLADYIFNNATPQVITYQTFNANKNLVAEITKNNGVVSSETYHFYNTDGNIAKDSIPGPNGKVIKMYDYYTDVKSTIENENFSAKELGKSNKNPVKKQVFQGPSSTIEYTYSLPQADAKGRVIATSYTTGANTIDYTYTYY